MADKKEEGIDKTFYNSIVYFINGLFLSFKSFKTWLARVGGKVVQHLFRHLTIKGSSPSVAVGDGREKKVWKVLRFDRNGQTWANRTKPGPSLQVAVFMLSTHVSVKQNSLA